MGASIGRMQYVARNNSQNQCCRNRQQQGRADSDADPWRWSGGVVIGWTLRRGQNEAQIVRGREARVQQADDGQPNGSAAHRG